jgi:hypothetical protein
MIDPSLPPGWPEPTDLAAYRRERKFLDAVIAPVLFDLLHVAWRYDYTAFLEALRKMGVRPHQRRELSDLFARRGRR